MERDSNKAKKFLIQANKSHRFFDSILNILIEFQNENYASQTEPKITIKNQNLKHLIYEKTFYEVLEQFFKFIENSIRMTDKEINISDIKIEELWNIFINYSKKEEMHLFCKYLFKLKQPNEYN